MAKFLQLATSLAMLAVSPTPVVANQVPHQLTSRATTPTPTPAIFEYVPSTSTDLKFDNYQSILEDIKNSDYNTNILAKISIEKLANMFNDQDFENSVPLFIAKSPFTSISAVFKDIAKTNIDDFMQNQLPQFSVSSNVTAALEQAMTDVHKKIIDDFNNYNFPNDIYHDALNDPAHPELKNFAQYLKDMKIDLKESDVDRLIIAAAKDVLDADVINANNSVAKFQEEIIKKFQDADAFKDAVAQQIAKSYIDHPGIVKAINDGVDKTYDEAKANIKKFGLDILSTNFETVQTSYKDILSGTATGTGVDKITQDLEDNLGNINSLSEAKKIIDDFDALRTKLVDSAKDVITNHANDLIKQVQGDWDGVLASIKNPISYWDAIQTKDIKNSVNDNSKDLDAFRHILSNEAPLDAFLKKWSSDVEKDQRIANIDFQFDWKYDATLTAGQRTVTNYTVVLSKEVQNAQSQFVPDYSQHLDIWEHSVNNQALSVTTNDLAKIIEDDFKKNSKPSETSNVWAVNPTVSSLDMDKFWDAKDATTGQPVNQGDFDPAIMTFHNLKEVEELFPRLKSLIEDDKLGSANNEFKYTLQDALFGTNPIADISIVEKPSDKKTSPKVTNYDVKLAITDLTAQNTTPVSVPVQANNVPVYDEELDATFTNALKTLLLKQQAEPDESDDAKSFAGVVLGQLWKLPNATKNQDGGSDFNNLYELLNIFFFNGSTGTEPDGKTVSVIDPNSKFVLGLLDAQTGDKAVIDAKADLDKIKNNDPGKDAAQQAYDKLLLSKLNDVAKQDQLDKIQAISYTLLNKANPLQALESTADIIKNLKVDGKISWVQDAAGKWEVKVSFTSVSSRWKTDKTPSLEFSVAVHELSREINKSTQEVNESDKNYKPLLDQLNAVGDLSDAAYKNLQDQVATLKSKFEKAVYQEDTPEGIENLKGLYMGHPEIIEYEKDDKGEIKKDDKGNPIVKSKTPKTNGLIGDAINVALNLQPSDELSTLPPDIPNYIKGLDKNGDAVSKYSLIKSSANVSRQFNDAYADYRSVLASVAPTLAMGILNNQDPTMTKDKLVADIEQYISLKGREKYGTIVGNGLSEQDHDAIASLEETFKQAGISAEIKTLIDPIIKVETIANVAYNITEQSAKISGSDKNSEIKKLATYKIADYLAHADLSDMQELKILKNFLESPLSESQVNLQLSMKIALIALGGFMGLVGLGASFSTLRSILTNKNLKTIGEDASIEYEKPKKTMAIKTVISVAALMSAATIITLVLTLWGGL